MKRRTDEEISAPLYAYDADIRAQYGCFAGVDEAGRGPLAGPVCAAAVILPQGVRIEGVNDSKKLTEKKREALFDIICNTAVAYAIEFVSPTVIDEINIRQATSLAMHNAVQNLDRKADHIIIDGNDGIPFDTPYSVILSPIQTVTNAPEA